jgi:hypothetical protein
MKIISPITTVVKGCAMAAALSAFAMGAHAAPAPYANAGTENLIEYSFTAATTGDITAWFVGKGGAEFVNTLSISINGVETGISGLNNQTSVYGQSLNFGHANAGDTVVFSLNVTNFDRIWSSTKSQNIDDANHVYASAFGGDQSLPIGLYVAFEDLKGSTSDFNYLDAQFIITNITTGTNTPEVPVPAAAWLMGSGLLGLAGVARRRARNA